MAILAYRTETRTNSVESAVKELAKVVVNLETRTNELTKVVENLSKVVQDLVTRVEKLENNTIKKFW